jgi:peptidoglycan/LPS O-acetylase OafA/YrhL
MKSRDETAPRFSVLDGWRGVSILLVLATHLLPVGPKSWRLNPTCGPMGMAFFFTLSGFLITIFLLHNANVLDFLIRRFFRIVPVAWIAIAIGMVASHAATRDYAPNFFFYSNLPPHQAPEICSHLWSLCVEMQFYVAVALLVAALGSRGLLALPLVCFAVTATRVAMKAEVSGITYLRVDEILAGGILALVHDGKLGPLPGRLLARVNPYVLAVLLVVSCHPLGGFMNYLRPYLASMLVGTTLFNGDRAIAKLMRSPSLKYIGAISYCLYVNHQFLEYTWLGSGSKLVKYAKRPLLIAASFAIAHLSTFGFENRCIALGKRLSLALRGTVPAPAPAPEAAHPS